jgi:hypothetical protein
MAILTEEQARRLHEAIDKANKPEGLSYRDPCFIGALAIIEGVAVADLETWDSIRHANFITLTKINAPNTEKLNHYPLSLLAELQNEWDLPGDSNADQRRERMHAHVEYYNDNYEPLPSRLVNLSLS